MYSNTQCDHGVLCSIFRIYIMNEKYTADERDPTIPHHNKTFIIHARARERRQEDCRCASALWDRSEGPWRHGVVYALSLPVHFRSRSAPWVREHCVGAHPRQGCAPCTVPRERDKSRHLLRITAQVDLILLSQQPLMRRDFLLGAGWRVWSM